MEESWGTFRFDNLDVPLKGLQKFLNFSLLKTSKAKKE